MVWIIYGWVSAYGAFVEKYPYMARKVWALFLMNNMWPIVDLYTLSTMNNDSWLTRAADAQYVKDTGNAKKVQDVSEMLFKFTS